MVINRRIFLSQMSTVALATAVSSYTKGMSITTGHEHIIGTCRLDEKHYAVSSIQLDGRLDWQLVLPSRGHDVCCHNDRPIGVVIARRPDRFITLFNATTGDALHEFEVDHNLKLNGHACWIGDRLLVSASDRTSSQMCLLSFILEQNQLRFMTTQYYNYFGAHEIIYRDNHIWVAVGGLKTTDRDVTNKDSLESFLLCMDAQSLSVKNEYAAPVASVSLRHLTISEDGQVYIAGQYQLDPNQSPALLFCLRNDELLPFAVDHTLWSQVKGYIGSIQCVGNSVVASSPRSHWLGWFDFETLTLQKIFLTADVCALAKTQQGLMAGTGTGRLYFQGKLLSSKVKWDNHFASYLIKV